MKVKATDLLMDAFRQADAYAQKQAARAGTTCRRGCNHCCKLLATIGVADGALLGEEILSRPDWEEWTKKLVEAGKAYCYEGINKTSWFRKKIDCVFLKDGECSVYEKRPAACRYHYVISPPEDCSPDKPESTQTQILNFIELEAATSWEVSMQILPSPISAPIPIMVLFGMAMVLVNDDPRRPAFLKLVSGQVSTPHEWLLKYAAETAEETVQDFLKSMENEQQVPLAPEPVIKSKV